MGCAGSTGNFGPITKLRLLELDDRESDEEVLEENEFPYMSSRLKDIPYNQIIEMGEPWTDPTFPPGPECLFISGDKPLKENKAKEKWMKFDWKRASDYYNGDFKIFDNVDPSDIIMGSCNNCYMLAALSGIAEAH